MSQPFIYNRNPAFIKQDLNNGALKFINAMPQKDSTSDGESSFEMARKIYTKTNQPYQSKTVSNTKKWVGGNRDSSSFTTNRKNSTIGKGSINTNLNQTVSFTTYKDVNTVYDALRRVRAGGAVAPPKTNIAKFPTTNSGGVRAHPTVNCAVTAIPNTRNGFSSFSPRITTAKSNSYAGYFNPRLYPELYK
jgi:hypothetical protein